MTDALLSRIAHRPWALPQRPWQYYQEWNNALFLHWAVPVGPLRGSIPSELPLDTFDGRAYISLVAFTMERIRPRRLPAVDHISCFEEINVRTYIDRDGKKGVYFLSIEAGKAFSAFVARTLSSLPYQRSMITREKGHINSKDRLGQKQLDVVFEVGDRILEKTVLDRWLTERYSLYYMDRGAPRRYEVHHDEWPLHQVELRSMDLNYQLGGSVLDHHPDMVHYSPGVQVVSWGSQLCGGNG